MSLTLTLKRSSVIDEQWKSLPAEKSCSCSCEGEQALGVDVPAKTEAEEPAVLEDGNQETVNGPSRVTVLVRRPVSTCHRVNRRTRLRQRNCRESVSSEFRGSE
jgi:hypothetical protein